MKKVIISALSAVAILTVAAGITSCSKSYSCECSYDNSGTPETVSTSLQGYTRVDAKASCDAIEIGLKSSFSDASCSLK